jgi:hypothetical protein
MKSTTDLHVVPRLRKPPYDVMPWCKWQGQFYTSRILVRKCELSIAKVITLHSQELFLAYVPYFEKKKCSSFKRAVCVSVCIPLSLLRNGSVKIPSSLLGNGSVETLPR